MSKKRCKDGPELLHVRLDCRMVDRVGKLAEKSGKSRNELVSIALEEFTSVMMMAEEIEAEIGTKNDPSDFVRILGPRWCSRLVGSALGTPGMEIGLGWFLAEQRRLGDEIQADNVRRKSEGGRQ